MGDSMNFFLILFSILFTGLNAQHFSSKVVQTHDQIMQTKDIRSFKLASRQLISILEKDENYQIPKSLLEQIKRNFNHPERDFSRYTWRLYPCILRALTYVDSEKSKHFYSEGFTLGKLAPELAENFLDALSHSEKIPIVTEDHDENYTFNQGFRRYEEGYSKSFNFFMLEKEQITKLEKIIYSLDPEISDLIGCNWRILNTRCWETIPNEYFVGAQNWHTDGMPDEILKLMIYLKGANKEIGSTELIKTDGDHFTVDSKEPCWLLFKNSTLVHRGVPSATGNRYIVELTLAPALQKDLTPVCAGLNAQHPILPWNGKKIRTRVKSCAKYLNIGGGPYFKSPNWINLEEVPSHINPTPFKLTPACSFPIEDEEIEVIYTSHAMEHLNLPTVYRVLSECNRVIDKSGYLIIKIPDFDKALESWKKRNISFFSTGWNIESVTPLWSEHKVCDCIDHRAAMIFCSFYNHSYGNPFQANTTKNEKAYFGPPRISARELQRIIQNKSPSEIAQTLRNLIIENTSENFEFCHQSAWSRDELIDLLEKFDFEVISFSANQIISDFSFVPGIDLMKPLSTYCLAKKKNL